MRHVLRYLQIETGPRRPPSACAEILKKKRGRVREPHAHTYAHTHLPLRVQEDEERRRKLADGDLARMRQVRCMFQGEELCSYVPRRYI